MLETATEFFMKTPAMWGFVIFPFLIVIGYLFYRWRRGKKKRTVSPKDDPDMADTIGLPKDKPESAAVTEPATAVTAKEAALPVPAAAAAPAPAPPEIREFLKVGPDEKYKAVIKWYPKKGRTPLIEFSKKINIPLGGLYFAEPSCPTTGDVYFIKQNADGSFSPYEPRTAILSRKTPYMAWHALHWEEARIWLKKSSNWFGKVSTIAVYIAVILVFVLVLVKVSG